MTKPKCRCKAPLAPHPRHRCNHRYEDHPGARGRMDRPAGWVPGQIALVPSMGGDVASLLERTAGRSLELPCGHVANIGPGKDQWSGYPHDGGVADGSGSKWWAFLRCDICGNEAAAWKVERRIRELPPPSIPPAPAPATDAGLIPPSTSRGLASASPPADGDRGGGAAAERPPSNDNPPCGRCGVPWRDDRSVPTVVKAGAGRRTYRKHYVRGWAEHRFVLKPATPSVPSDGGA